MQGTGYLVLLKELREMTSPDLFTSRIFIYSSSTVAHGLARFFQSSCPLPNPLPEEKWLPFLRTTLQFMYGHRKHSCLFIKQIETSVFDKICSTFKYREVPIC